MIHLKRLFISEGVDDICNSLRYSNTQWRDYGGRISHNTSGVSIDKPKLGPFLIRLNPHTNSIEMTQSIHLNLIEKICIGKALKNWAGASIRDKDLSA